MFCSQCGFKMEEGFKFCPNCGAKVLAFRGSAREEQRQETCGQTLNGGYRYCPDGERRTKKEMPQEEVKRIADEIVSWCPSKVRAVKVLRDRTGLDLRAARDTIDERYATQCSGEYMNDVCPKCGSGNIVYEKEPDTSTTVSYFEGVYHTTHRSGMTRAKCKNCGKKWKF